MIKNLRRTIAEGGKIKIGGLGRSYENRKSTRSRLPTRYDHIVITHNERDENGDLIVNHAVMAELVKQGYADDTGKVRKLPIMLHSDDIDQVFPTALACYTGRVCACRGDGETATRWEVVDGAKTGKSKEVSCPCELLEQRRCKYSGILHCSLRLPGHAVIGSVYKWRTTSQISCQQMVGHLEAILYTVGTLRGLPLALVIRPVKVSPAGQSQREVYVCHVDLCEQIALAQEQALAAQRMRTALGGDRLDAFEANYRATLELPGHEAPEEQQLVAEEYYPDEIIDAPADVQAALVSPTAPSTQKALEQIRETFDPDQQPEPKKRTRRTTCKSCGEKFGPGIVKDGLCGDCREKPARDPKQSEMPAAPARPKAPPAQPKASGQPPHDRVQAAVEDAVTRVGDAARVLQSLYDAVPGSNNVSYEYTEDDATAAEEALQKLQKGGASTVP